MSEKTINTKPKSLFERMGVTYTEGADGLLYPDIVLTEDTPHYGKYGEMRKRYLQQHDHALYSSLSLKGKLVAHLNDIDDTCNERMERMVAAMAEAEGVTEELKANDQMEWVRSMNSIINRAEEAVCYELIYDRG